jgi:hypothetical protein
MRTTILAAAAAAMVLPVAAPAIAKPPPWAPAHGYRDKHDDRRDYRRYERQRQQAYAQQRYYAQQGYNGGYQPTYYTSGNGIRYWQGDSGQYYCRRSNGTTGMIIGAAAGALLGNRVVGGTTATIVGGVAGAVIGKQLEQGRARCN